MGVNKHKPHLVVYMEDNPYRDLVNGMKKLPNINDFNIDSKNPCGGWNKTLSKLEENLNLINSNENMFVLLLMDFDNKFNERYSKFENILKEQTPEEKTTEEILKDAKNLHEDLRNYGSIQDKDKPLIVSGILLALREMEHKGFSIESLIGDETNTDGEKIYEAIEKNLKRSNVAPQVKKEKLLSQFLVIKDTKAINEINEGLKKTPLKHFTEFLYENIYKNIKYLQSAEDAYSVLSKLAGLFRAISYWDGDSIICEADAPDDLDAVHHQFFLTKR